ncbi:MAG: hypothetical protein R3C03_10510 [Pirellulaceae bacterium]
MFNARTIHFCWHGVKFLFAVALLLATASTVNAQVTVQFPSYSVFNINTVVMAPDGGAITMGGNRGGRYGSNSRGISPLGIRGLNNRAAGAGWNSSTTQARVQVIDMQEMEKAVVAEGERRAALRASSDPNGSAETQQRAPSFPATLVEQKRNKCQILTCNLTRIFPSITKLLKRFRTMEIIVPMPCECLPVSNGC